MAKKKQAAALVSQSRQLAAQGRYAEARDAARKAIELERKNADAWYLLGGTYGTEDKHAPCIRHSQQALRLNPGHTGALSNIARSHLARGDHDAAIDALRRVLRIRPKDAAALKLLGDAWDAAARPDKAAEAYVQAIDADPKLVGAYERLAALAPENPQFQAVRTRLTRLAQANNGPAPLFAALSSLALKVNATFEATDWANRAVASKPDWAPAHSALGTAYLREMHHSLAAEAFRKAVELEPTVPGYQCGLARALAFSGESEEGGALIERLYREHPDEPLVVRTMGVILARTGQHEAASSHYRKLTKKEAPVYFELAQSMRFKPGAPEIDEVEAALADADQLPPRDRAQLLFALGKMLDDVGHYDRAFHYFEEGNRIVRQTIDYRPEQHRAFFERIAAHADAETLQPRADSADNSRVPIFIVGMPRSGTTLLESIIGAHPRVRAGGELPLVALLARYLEHAASKPFPHFLKNTDLPAHIQREAVAALVDDMVEIARGADHVTDKMPDNFKYLALVRRLLPNARIIHIQRHPADTCLSIFQQLFNPEKHRYSWDLAELGEHYRLYLGLMEHWRQVLGADLIEVRYEDLIRNREGETRRLLTRCGLEWHDRCLTFRRSQDVVHTASQWQVRQSVYETSLARYKHYEAHLGPLLDALGACVTVYERGLEGDTLDSAFSRTDLPLPTRSPA